MTHKLLTDPYIRDKLRPAPTGKRKDVLDRLVPGLLVRVTDKGRKSFLLRAAFPEPTPRWRERVRNNPRSHRLKDPDAITRRFIGDCSVMTIEEARETANDWLKLIRKGVDPRAEAQRRRNEELRKRADTFGVVIEDYITRHLKGKRKAAVAEREIRFDLVPAWKDKPLSEITRRDVVQMIDKIIDRGAPYQAHNVFGHVRKFFNWAITRDLYGLETSPCDRLKPADVTGFKKEPRVRVLDDDEICALWRAARRIGNRSVNFRYGSPFGPLFQLLLLTGQRKSDVANATWPEFDFERKLWTIPAARYKAEHDQLVPLPDDAVSLLTANRGVTDNGRIDYLLPRFTKGDYAFCDPKTFGAKPVNGFSKAKARLDREMLRTLRAIARKRGDDNWRKVKLKPFVIHDIRRTVRTRLSPLCPFEVAELVIGHSKKGLARVYDQHKYLNEMRAALTAWNATLRAIVEPRPSNVVQLKRERKPRAKRQRA